MHGELAVLGPVRAGVRGSELRRISNRRQARILAALVTARRREATVDELIERVFGDGDRPDNPEPSLRTYVNRLRKAIGDESGILLATTPGGYRLDRVRIDADEFERLVDEASAELDPYAAIALLERVLDLWSGRPYEGIDDTEWLAGEVTRLAELRLTAVEQRLHLLNEAGRHARTIQETAALVDEVPFREGLRRLRTVALYRSGRQTDALRELAEHRARMRDELGLDPDAALLDIERRILSQDPTLDGDAGGGRRLRGYRIGPLAGIGAHSTVYRAQQPIVDRQVAVRIIRKELANRPEFVRRFQSEARMVARLVHPHIVPLFDFWREPDRACLVMPWMDGGSLESRLGDLDGIDGIDGEVVLRQIGSALAHAHAAGVTHRDVTTRNVLLDRDGNAYLSDFGVAVGEPDVDDDIRAFAVLAQQVVPGSDPRQFVPTADGDDIRELANPYRGLDAFDSADASRFFGRDASVARVVDALGRFPVTILVGPSGSGKSSLAGAGVLPALEAGGRLVATMVPGVKPTEHLLEAISALSTDADIDLADIADRGLAAVCARATQGAPSALLIDQFEELFTTSDGDERSALLRALASIEPDDDVRVLVAVRADFYGTALGTRELAPAAANATVPLPLMSASELTAAIVSPAEALGVSVDRELVAKLITQTVDRPGGLPLLQFVLTQMWDRRRRPRQLTVDDLGAVGGVDGVVSSVADAVLDGLDGTARDGARRVFSRLVHVGDDVTGRRSLLSELLELPDVDRPLVDALVDARLVTTGHDAVTREPTVELAHESLIDTWPTLRAWTDEGRRHLEVLQRLRRDAAEWHQSQRDEALLWRGSRLSAAVTLRDDTAVGLTDREQAFLTTSAELEAEQRDAEQHAAQQATARRRVLAVLAVVGVVAIAAIGWAVRNQRQAITRQAEADHATLVSNATSLIGSRDDLALLLAVEAFGRDDGLASQRLLVEALAAFDEIEQVWTEPQFDIGTARGYCVDQPQPGRLVIQPNRADDPPDPIGDVVDIDLAGREVTVVEDVPVACDVHAAPGDADAGPLYAGTTGDGELVTVEPNGTVHGPFPKLSRPHWSPDGTLYARTGDPDEPGEFRAVDPRTGAASGRPVATAIDLRSSPAGTATWALLDLVETETNSEPTAKRALLDPHSFEVLVDLPDGLESYSPPSFSADGSTVVIGDQTSDLSVIEVQSGEQYEVAVGVTPEYTAVSPSGSLIAASTVINGNIEVRRLPDGDLVDTIVPAVRPTALEWLSEERLAVVRSNGVVDIVELGGSLYERGPACCPSNTVFTMFSSDGSPERFAYTALQDGTGRFDDYPSRRTSTVDMSPFVLTGGGASELRLPNRAAMLVKQDGNVLWVDGTGELVETMAPLGPDLPTGAFPEWQLAREQDSREAIVFTVTKDTSGVVQSMRLVWIDTLRRRVVEGPIELEFDGRFTHADVHPGPVVLTGADAGPGRRRVTWRDFDGEPFDDVVLPAPVRWARLSVDRRYVVAAKDDDDSIRWFDLETDRSQVLPVNAGGQMPEMLTDGRFLLQTREGQFELWDGTVPARIAVLADPGPDAILNPSVSLDQSHVWVFLDGFWTNIPLDPDTWVEQACALAGRSLTDEERADFAPGAAAEATCPG